MFICSWCISSPFNSTKWQNLASSKLREFSDNNSENGAKFSKWVENAVEKGTKAQYMQFPLFPQEFQKTCTADK